MANIHTLVPSVNNICLLNHNQTGKKLCCQNAAGTLTTRRSHGGGDSDFHIVCGARDSAVGRSWRLNAATDLRVVQESYSKSVNASNQVPIIEIPVTCYEVFMHSYSVQISFRCPLYNLLLLTRVPN